MYRSRKSPYRLRGAGPAAAPPRTRAGAVVAVGSHSFGGTSVLPVGAGGSQCVGTAPDVADQPAMTDLLAVNAVRAGNPQRTVSSTASGRRLWGAPARETSPPAGQDHCQWPDRLRLGQDPLGEADLPAARDQLGAEPYQQAEQRPGGGGADPGPQPERQRRPPPPAASWPARQGYEADRRPERVGQRAATGRLGVGRDQQPGYTASDQGEPPGCGHWP